MSRSRSDHPNRLGGLTLYRPPTRDLPAGPVRGARSRAGPVLVGALLCPLLGAPAARCEEPVFTELTPHAVQGAEFVFARMAFGDQDNDGWPDLFVTETPLLEGRMALLRNGGGRTFAEDPESLPDLGPGVTARWKGVPVFADVDNDGDADLYVAVGAFRAGPPHAGVLLRNDRGTYADVTAQYGLPLSPPAENAVWLDYDRDGSVDLYVGHWVVDPVDERPVDSTIRNRLLRNDGGRFTDVTAPAGLELQLSEAGGSAAGMAAADFDEDGWSDLYLGVRNAANRLFLNDGNGSFSDATRGDLADVGESFGVAVGDINNDGTLDILQAAGGGVTKGQRSLLLYNLGGGDFVDVIESSGLPEAARGEELRGPGLADFDNDGDLDLVTGTPRRLFTNDGRGVFARSRRAHGLRQGDHEVANIAALADIDRDGAMDLWFDLFDRGTLQTRGRLARNNGAGGHWLEVDLVGVASDRGATGARVACHAGDLRQTRAVLGGRGWQLDDRVVHFGLGPHVRVDSLVVHWPSGSVEVIRDLAVDGMVRVIEGRGGSHPVEPMEWRPAADTLVAGSVVDWEAGLRVSPFDPEAVVVNAEVDLAQVGGPAAARLAPAGDGSLRLRARLAVPGEHGRKRVRFLVEQSTSLGPYWSRLTRYLAVVPAGDLVIFGDRLAESWRAEPSSSLGLGSADFGGATALSLSADGFFTLTLLPGAAVDLVGLESIRLAFHPGSASLPSTGSLILLVNTQAFPLTGPAAGESPLDFRLGAWQVAEVRLDSLRRGVPIQRIQLRGQVEGTFYLDDLRIAVVPFADRTAVAEREPRAGLPAALALGQSYPNPFNGSVQIPYALARGGHVQLAVYDLLGQRLTTLVDEVQAAGDQLASWDGRDGEGVPAASGVYLYTVTSAGQVLTRRLALVR